MKCQIAGCNGSAQPLYYINPRGKIFCVCVKCHDELTAWRHYDAQVPTTFWERVKRWFVGGKLK